MNQNNTTKSIKKYLRTINKTLPLTRKKRKDVMTHFSKGVWEYYAEQPDMTMENIYQEFGTVEEVVDSLIAEIPSEYIIKNIHTKRIAITILIGIIIALVIYSIVYRIQVYYSVPTEVEIETIIYPPEREE